MEKAKFCNYAYGFGARQWLREQVPHIPMLADLNNDRLIGFADFSAFATYGQQSECGDCGEATLPEMPAAPASTCPYWLNAG